jgi:hypothetical protein
MNLFSKLFSRFKKDPVLQVVVHDPEASQPHNLDDPFFDAKVQERVGNAISNAMRKQ